MGTENRFIDRHLKCTGVKVYTSAKKVKKIIFTSVGQCGERIQANHSTDTRASELKRTLSRKSKVIREVVNTKLLYFPQLTDSL